MDLTPPEPEFGPSAWYDTPADGIPVAKLLPAKAADDIPTLTPLPADPPLFENPFAFDDPPARDTPRRAAPDEFVEPAPPPAPPSIEPLLVVMAFYAIQTLILFVTLGLTVVLPSDQPWEPDSVVRERLLRDVRTIELVDTGLVLLALVLAGRPPPPGEPTGWGRGLAWAASVPGFAVLFGFNVAYHYALQLVFRPDANLDLGIGLGDGLWALVLVCVQPAVVEEFFFRYLLLGHLRPHLGTHGAVWVSAVVFGTAHVSGVVSWPVLVLLGAGLGYVRVGTGTLALPILLHFLHNFGVLLVEHVGK
jgi:membrane protease YdiL (CAAX protease family)